MNYSTPIGEGEEADAAMSPADAQKILQAFGITPEFAAPVMQALQVVGGGAPQDRPRGTLDQIISDAIGRQESSTRDPSPRSANAAGAGLTPSQRAHLERGKMQ